MKLMKRLMCAALAAAALLSSAPAFAAEASETAVFWSHSIYVEGNEAYSWNDGGQRLFYLNCGGTVYTPVHTAAEWLGKDYTRSADGKTLTLSGSKAPVFHGWAEDLYESLIEQGKLEEYRAKKAAPVQVSTRTDAKLIVDGVEKPANIIDWEGTAYMPVRTAAELLGMDIKYASADAGRRVAIYLRTPVTDEQLKACQSYIAALAPVSNCKLLHQNMNSYKTVEDISNALTQAIEYMNLVKNTQPPVCKLMDGGLCEETRTLADEAIKACTNVQQMIKNGADRRAAYSAIAFDWTGTIGSAGYKDDGKDDGKESSNGALALCGEVASRLDQLGRIVNQTP